MNWLNYTRGGWIVCPSKFKINMDMRRLVIINKLTHKSNFTNDERQIRLRVTGACKR